MKKGTGKVMQLTLAILKPDIMSHPHLVHQIKQTIHQHGFYFIRSQQIYLPRKRVEEFYKEHHGKFFYNRLVNFMSSGPLTTHILARENAISEWRNLMGPTKVFRTIYSHPNTIRGKFGLTDTRNATHGSDSDETARKEIKFFFPAFDIDQWYREDEKHFVNGQVSFDSDNDVHTWKAVLDKVDLKPEEGQFVEERVSQTC